MDALNGPIADQDDSGQTASHVDSAASPCDHTCESGRVEVTDVARILVLSFHFSVVG